MLQGRSEHTDVGGPTNLAAHPHSFHSRDVENHTTGQFGGQTPTQWLADQSYHIWPVCSLLITT